MIPALDWAQKKDYGFQPLKKFHCITKFGQLSWIFLATCSHHEMPWKIAWIALKSLGIFIMSDCMNPEKGMQFYQIESARSLI